MTHEEYWRKREEEALKHYIKDEKEYDREIKRIYSDMLDASQKEIDSFYAKYAGKEGITLAEAKKRVSKLDIAAYERKAKRYVKAAELDRQRHGKTDKNAFYFSERANEEMRLYNATMKINRLEMLKANIGLELLKGHAELETFLGDILQGRTMEELERQAGILGKSVVNNAKRAHAIVNASFHNATFSDRLWMNHDIMKADLSKLLQSGMIQGKSPIALAKELRKYYIGDDKLKNGKSGAIYSTERLMRTELARVQTEAQKQSFVRNGFDMYTFHANTGCCGDCQSLDGKHFKVSEMMAGNNAPPIHPHCRCSTSAYEDSAEYDAWLDYLEKGGNTEEWNKTGLAAWKRSQGKADKAEEPRSKFTPAKTIEEAEEYAKQFADYVSYAGATDIDAVNEINETLQMLHEKYPTKPVEMLTTNARMKSASAMANWRKLEYSIDAINDKTTYTQFNWQERIAENKKKIAEYLPKTDKTKYPSDIVKLYTKFIKTREEENKYSRYHVSSSIKDTTIHEYGHIIADQYFGQCNGKYANPNYSKAAGNRLYERALYVAETYKKAKRSGDIYGISNYSSENDREFFAETFAMYVKGEALPDYITEMMEKVLNDGIL